MSKSIMKLVDHLDRRACSIRHCPSSMPSELWTDKAVYPQCMIYGTAETGQQYIHLHDGGAELEDEELIVTNYSEILIRIDNSANCACIADPYWTECFEWLFKFADLTQQETLILLDCAVKEVGSMQVLIMALRSAVYLLHPNKKS